MENDFGTTLKDYRTKMNLSQQQLANRLYVNRSSVANWETGRRVPDLIIINRIAEILNVDVSDLISTTDIDTPPYVIVVDDETILLSGAIFILSEAMPKANIIGFSKASEATEFALNNRVSIAFLDIELGKANGLELCEELMRINPSTNVIFLTSYPDYAVNAWKTAASGFLVKPLHLEDVNDQLLKLRFPVKGVLS